MDALQLAYAYLRNNWARSLVMVLVAALILFVPVATQILLSTNERTLTARADTTPLILDNLESFHFHGAENGYPTTAVIVVPYDTRAGTILRGRYLDPDTRAQLFEPAGVVQGLVDRIFRIKTLLDVVTAIIAIAALAAVGLAVFLSYRLRAGEIATAVKLGACKGMVLRLLAAETVTLLLVSGLLATGGAALVARNAEAWVGWLLALGT